MLEFAGRFAAAYTGADASAWWIMAAGSLAAAGCALVGCFLVLRRLAMIGDAISHAVLPGIVAAFLWSGSRGIVPMLAGAAALGLLTVFLTDLLNRQGRLQSDAAVGVTFTWLFALGVILVSRYAGQIDLDLDCVLFGEILYVPFDTWQWGGWEMGPRSVWTLGAAAIADLLFVVLAWKQLKVASFDPGLAAALGFRVVLWHYLLMAAVSITTVAAFESVGAILVVAMLVIPANTALMLTDRLWAMVLLATMAGVAAALIGYGLATALDTSIAGAMTVAGAGLYVAAALFAPRHGVLPKAWRRRRAPTPAPEAA